MGKKVLCKGIDFDSVVKNTKSQNQYLYKEPFSILTSSSSEATNIGYSLSSDASVDHPQG